MKVVWSKLAKSDYQGQIDYLFEEQSEKAAIRFIEQVEDVLYLLKSSPEMYPPSEIRKGLRKAVVNKWINLYYGFEANNQTIQLYRFWHNSQDPRKLKF